MDFYIFEDSSDLENLPLLNIELTLNLHFYFLDGFLKLWFLTRCLYFHHSLWKEFMRNKNELFKYFWKLLLSKKIEILKHSWQFDTVDNLNIQKIELLKIKLSYELPSKLNYILSKTYKKSHSTIQTIIALNKFVFHPYNCLFPLWIWVTESQLQQLPFLFIS